ncbi:MAG: hypothetical protein KatS3mg024_1245 [Armatimonadota bacterium]|nr:MAG: hypothetical protein KatS3mg024_1245 [Armatimonadota bacterium]
MAVQGGAAGYSPAPRVRFEAIGEAWNLFKADAGTWVVTSLIALIVLGVVIAAVNLVNNLFTEAAQISSPAMTPAALLAAFGSMIIVQIISSLITTVAWVVVTAGIYRMALRRMRGEQVSAGDLFNIGDVFPQVLVAGLLASVIVTIGYLLCIIPGIIAGGLLMFTVPLIVDRQMDGVEAISTSFRILSADLLNAVLFYAVLSFIVFIGLLACGVGILVTFPLYPLGVAIVYRDFFPDQVAAQPAQQW